jgi:hypothetical protein
MNDSHNPTSTIAKAFAIAIVIAALTVAGYVAFVKAPSDLVGNVKDGTADAADKAIDKVNKGWDTAKRIGNDIDKVINLRPKVTMGGTTVVEASKEIAEMSLVEKPFEHTYTWEHVWLGSTKRLTLKGHFIAKAGYDLTKPFSIDVSEDGQSIRATVPPAKLNSLDQLRVEILKDESGIWNGISKEDRQNAINALNFEAKKALERTSLLSDADAALMTRLEGVIRKNAPTASIARDPSPLP